MKLNAFLPVVALLLATSAFVPAARAEDTTTTTTTYHSQTNYSTSYYNWNPFASDAQGVYVSGQVGGAFPDDDLDDGAVYSAALGWQFSPWLRTELEGAYRNLDVDGGPGEADIWSVLLNGYWDFKNDTLLTPYLGAGLGYAHQNLDGTVGGDDTDGSFAYKGIAGLAFEVTPNVALTAEYNYIDTTNFDYSASEVKGGVRVLF